MATHTTSYVLHIVRLVDQYCSLNRVKWNMHGAMIRKMLCGNLKLDEIQEIPLEFVIFSDSYYSHKNMLPVETIVRNMNISGFVTLEKHQNSYTLQGVYTINNNETYVKICLSSSIHHSFFTSDVVVLDSFGITVRSTNGTSDSLNDSYGVALLDRVLKVQSGILEADTIILPVNQHQTHKDHNSSFLKEICRATREGFTVTGTNVHIHQPDKEECAVCMEDGKCFIKLSCEHRFCIECIGSILINEDHPRCSMCRAQLCFAM